MSTRCHTHTLSLVSLLYTLYYLPGLLPIISSYQLLPLLVTGLTLVTCLTIKVQWRQHSGASEAKSQETLSLPLGSLGIFTFSRLSSGPQLPRCKQPGPHRENKCGESSRVNKCRWSQQLASTASPAGVLSWTSSPIEPSGDGSPRLHTTKSVGQTSSEKHPAKFI